MILWNRVLVGLDSSEAALNAVRYLAGVLGGANTCKVRLLAVHQAPAQEDPSLREEAAGGDDELRLALEERLLEAYHILVQARLPPENLSTELVEAAGRTVGETIMAHQRQGGYGTVVVGRRGVSKAEEFLFGSVSSSVVRMAGDCCVWVVA